MLGPDSRLLTVLLIAAGVALLVATVRLRLLPIRAACGALSIVVAMTGGIALVNDYYGYYTTWGGLWSDLHGSGPGDLGVIATAGTSAAGAGRIGWTDLPGRLSGDDRQGLVYLPPQYAQARYARVRFPVVELFHGTPGSPRAWYTVLQVRQVADRLMAEHLLGPMVIVMPDINGPGHDFQDCVNGPASNDDTYLTGDVRADVLARYRVSADPFEWGAGGYSSGGYCAANLALRHRDSFGAAAVIEGYFRAADGPAAAVVDHRPSLEDANSPLFAAERLAPGSGPVPAFWISAGTGTSDYQPAVKFAAAMDRVEQVPFSAFHAGDSARVWAESLPAALTWLWQQLAPPDLRVLFPVHAPAGYLAAPPARTVKAGHPGTRPPHGKPGPTPYVTSAPRQRLD